MLELKYRHYCNEYENIENYEKAEADNFEGWCIHHRLQTWTSDGERREVDISADELIALNMYFERPANELIFLTKSEHRQLHNSGSGNPMCNEKYRKKISEKNKGKQAWNKGKKPSEETRKKMSDSWDYNKHFTEETKKKISEKSKGNTACRGLHWYNNSEIEIKAKERPDGYSPGRLKRK